MMVGTSGAMRAVWATREISIPPRLFCYRVDGARVVIGGALSNGGNLIAWLRDTLQVDADPDAMERAVAAEPPDGHGLTFLPFLAGERSTGWRPGAPATISGLRLHTRPVGYGRAALEAV